MLKPQRMFFHPGVIGRALKGNIHRDFKPETLCPRHQMLKICKRAKFRMYRSMSSRFIPDGPGTANIARLRSYRIVFAFAKTLADGMNRRQIENVEAHVSDIFKPPFGILEGAVFPERGRA